MSDSRRLDDLIAAHLVEADAGKGPDGEVMIA
jgi:hypothetical protein